MQYYVYRQQWDWGKIGEHHNTLFMGSNDSMVQSFVKENNSETRTEVPRILIWEVTNKQTVYTKKIRLEINFRQMC